MSVLAFVTRPRADLDGAVEVLPVVDGRPLTELVHDFELASGMEEAGPSSYGGLIPQSFRFGALDRHFLAAEGAYVDDDGRVPLLGCDCGEWGCWPLLAEITVDGDHVSWSDFRQPHRPGRDGGFGPFRFARQPYETALGHLVAALPDAEDDD